MLYALKNGYMAFKICTWLTKYVPLAIDHTIKDLVSFNNGYVMSGRVPPLQVTSFGEPVDMLYSELITEHFNAVAIVHVKWAILSEKLRQILLEIGPLLLKTLIVP